MDIEKEGTRKIVLLSCLGQRPLAVINPIDTLFKAFHYKGKNISLVFFYTVKTESIGEQCKEWFEREYPGIKVDMILFDKNNISTTLESLTKGAENIFFNANPGLNYMVATIALYLPFNTRFIYVDFSKIYMWALTEDVMKASAIELLDTGFDKYNLFSEKKFYPKDGINEGLTQNILDLLKEHGFDKHFEVKGKDIPEEGEVADFIRKYLVWVREIYGYIYLLFDLQMELPYGTKEEDKQKKRGEYLNMYRAITSIFDIMNHTITIITNVAAITKRAMTDGIGYIFVRDDGNWKNQVIRWIKGETKIKPKNIMNKYLEKNVEEKSQKLEATSCLYLCLGDNVEPTLKAILSHNLESACIFYDSESKRIRQIATRISEVFKDRNVHIEPTDNRGSGIIDYILKDSYKRKRVAINITPGTKSQSVALVQAARATGKPGVIYSIDNNVIRGLADPSVSVEVIGPSIDDLIKCHLPEYKGSRDIPDYPIFLNIMKGLAKKEISFKNGIFNITDKKNKHIFVKTTDSNSVESFTVFCTLDGKTYTFPPDFFDSRKSGVWWEAVCAYVLKENLTEEIRWGTTWCWPNQIVEDIFFAEIDIVFRWKQYICVVSCKTSIKNGLSETTKLTVKNQAANHFGRFALPFVAVPFDVHKGKDYTGLIEDGVMYLTPSLMINKERLSGKLEGFVKSKRTTAEY
ncbi:MAG: hypothetical protein N2745_09400 [Syntrophorhabdaceae bacterium]|nr:hypothetical protein [Syntrophorhabdaceae bacterium]